jgi:DeoR/GlpR family transcriptional regulator of sugar metabolism
MDVKELRISVIVNEIIKKGQVDIKTMAQKLNVSQMTIYRDVDALISSGVIKKEKGVIKSSNSFSLEYFHDVRASLNLKAKNKLVEEAGKLIKPNSYVAIDDSTTCLQFLNFQHYFEGTTVITNSYKLIEAFSKNPKIKLIAVGGRYQKSTGSFIGLLTEHNIGQTPSNFLFTSSSTLFNTQLYTHDEDVYRFKAAFISNAEYKYFLIDTSKIGKKTVNLQADMSDFDKCFIAGPELDPNFLSTIQKKKINFEFFKVKN